MSFATSRGFTLIEMLVVVALIAIIAAMGVPSYRSFVRESRLSSITEEMLVSMMLANTEATQQGKEIFIKPASGTDWRFGWTVAASGAENLRVVQAFNGIDSASGATLVSFKPLLKAGSEKVIEFCGVGAKKRTITLTSFGSVKNEQGTTNATVCP